MPGKRFQESGSGGSITTTGMVARYNVDQFSSTGTTSTWSDVSGNGLDLTAPDNDVEIYDDNGQLAIRTGQYNGNNWLHDASIDSRFHSDNITWVFVGRYWANINQADRMAFGGTFDYLYAGYGVGPWTGGSSGGHINNASEFRIGNSGNVDNISSGINSINPFNDYVLHVVRKDGLNVSQWVNGNGPVNDTADFNSNNHTEFFLGRYYRSYTPLSPNLFTEVIAYNQALSNSDIDNINTNLISKYGLIDIG